MRPARSRGSEGKAFTLIELMVVCILIAILTAMIIPEMRGSYEDALLRSTSRKLVNAFNLAYSEAVSRNQLDRVRLDTRAGKYFVEARMTKNGQRQFVPLRDLPGGEGDLDSRIAITIQDASRDSANASSSRPTSADALLNNPSDQGPIQTIAFYPDGTADARDVILRDRQGFRLALQINPITARVHVTDLGRETTRSPAR